tara:strand:+ start:861 stop:1178 length:318 start_codon:yes stop_codon:yes gene_type:complete
MASLILAMSCSEEPVEEIPPEPVILTESTSVCHCYDSAVSIYTALLLENKLEYRQAFWKLREECLTQFGTQLYIPSACNNPDYLQLLADSLRDAGIDINEGINQP